MRICIVASSGISLTNFRGSLIRSWVNKGHEVFCVSIEPPSEMNSAIGGLGAKYCQVAGNRVSTGVFSGLKMIKDYKRVFLKIRPDMCFLYMSKPVAFGGSAAIKVKIPHINILVNGLENAYYRKSAKDAFIRFVLNILYKRVFKKSEHVFYQNFMDRALYVKKHISSENQSYLVNGSGVDMEHFAKVPLPKEPVFLMVSRMLWSKGIREYLGAIPLVKKECPEAKFILVGGLDQNQEAIKKDELAELVEKYGIEYMGHADDVRPYIKKCSVFVLPSYHEGCPRCVLEAMSMGRPIITTNAPGCDDTVENGVNGFKVPAMDTKALADKMIVLSKNSNLRSKMGEASHRLCREKFEVSKVNEFMNSKMGI